MKKILWPTLLVFVSLIFFWQTFVKGLLPIPSDTIIGLYHPFRDLYAKDYPRGIPFKNFLITDPVRQQYVWKNLSIESLKKGEIPLWNPYSFSGNPLLANMQSGVFYPLNFLFVFPFHAGWALLIVSQSLLAALFTFFYLKNLRLDEKAAFLGAIAFSFGGFSIAWLEWGNIVSTCLWLPLILLSIDKIFENKKGIKWFAILFFSLSSSFFAGHLQTFFYLFILSFAYLILRWLDSGKSLKKLGLFAGIFLLFIILTSIQWIPTLKFITLSARELDQIAFDTVGWFIPWQHLIQFIAPDFFGNPTTLNYWGVWNYAEFIGYIGILPLSLAILSIVLKKNKTVLFFWAFTLLSLIFALPNFLAKIPYTLDIPFISSTQPTRILFLTSFSLSVLSGFGFDYFIKKRVRLNIVPLVLIGSLLLLLFAIINSGFLRTDPQNILVAKRNLAFPLAIFFGGLIIYTAYLFASKKLQTLIILGFVGLTIVDLFRFGWKFTPFTPKEYLFPETQTTKFLKENIGNFRMMSADPRILPPNFPAFYKLQSIEGYDPLYLRKYAEFSIAMKRDKPNIEGPFNFNRIILPSDPKDRLIDLMGVKYVLSLDELNLPKLKKVFEEGQTKVYENTQVMPRAFFVEKVTFAKNNNEAIELVMDENFNPRQEAILEGAGEQSVMMGEVEVLEYSENRIRLQTHNLGNGFLVLTDNFYPDWKVKIDNKVDQIYPTDYTFRGVYVPKGEHTLEFYNALFK